MDSSLENRRELWVVLICSLLGALAVWWSTAIRGIGITVDSVSYLSTAENLLDGNGFGSPWENPLRHWPLGYPVILASVAKLLGLSVQTSARIVGSLLVVGTAWFAWHIAVRTIDRRGLRLAVVAATVFAVPTVSLQNKLLTDGIFAVGALALVLVLYRAIESNSTSRWLAVAVVLTWAMFLVRYVGVVVPVVGAGVLLILPGNRALRHRIHVAILYAVASLVVPLGYLFWTFLEPDDTVGESVLEGLVRLPRVFTNWAMGKPSDAVPSLLGLAVLLGLAGAALAMILTELAARRYRVGPSDSDENLAVWSDAAGLDDPLLLVGTFWVGLLICTLTLRVVTYFDVDGRTLYFLFPLGVVYVGGLVDRVRRRGLSRLARVVFAGWCLVTSVFGLNSLLDVRTRGSGYRDRSFDAMYAEIEDVKRGSVLECPVISNWPELLYMAGVEAALLPTASDSWSGLDESSESWCLVLLQEGSPDDNPEQWARFSSRFDLTPAYAGDHLTVYTAGKSEGQP